MNPSVCGLRSFVVAWLLPLVFVPLSAGATGSKLDPAVSAQCLQILEEGLRAEAFWPSIHAAEALSRAGYGDIIRESLEPRLASETDDQRRCGLARELVRAGDWEKRRVLVAILEGDDPHGHIHAAESLFKVGGIGSSPALETAFRSSGDTTLKLMAAAALARKSHPEALAFLRQTLASAPNPETYRLAAWALARVGESADIEALRARLPDASEARTRAFLEHALAALGDEEGRIALRQNLLSEDPAIRTQAAVFAGEAGLIEAKDVLLRLLDDENLDTRIRAAQSLFTLAR